MMPPNAPVRSKPTPRAHIVFGAASLIAGLAVISAPCDAAAEPLAGLSVIAFPGTSTWPIRIAQERGFFARNGIEVNLSPTPNSVFQITSLVAGKFDIAMTAADNVVAYVEGQGEVALSQASDLFMFMGGSPSVPVVATIPEIKEYAGLRGQTLAVDALTTGYAFVAARASPQGRSDFHPAPASPAVAGIGGWDLHQFSRVPRNCAKGATQPRRFAQGARAAKRIWEAAEEPRRSPALLRRAIL